MPARGLGLPQPFLQATSSLPTPILLTSLEPASWCYDSQRQGACGSAQQQGWAESEGASCMLSGLGVGEGNMHVYSSPGNGLQQ